jgi:hypothetical protein
MNDPNSYTEVTSQGWGSRLMSSIKSVLTGLVLFLGSFFLLWWNEGNSVRTAKGLEEGSSSVVQVPADKILTENQNKLVYVTGQTKILEPLYDADFENYALAVKYRRDVSMYQWVEKKEEKEEKKIGGGTEKKTTYRYSTEWSPSLINSSNFKVEAGHENPQAMRFESIETSSTGVTVGEFNLSSGLIGSMDDYTPYPVDSIDLTRFEGARVFGTGSNGGKIIYFGRGTPESPALGDLKISFSQVLPSVVSIIAKQNEKLLEGYTTSTGSIIELLSTGTVTPQAMFTAAQERNSMMTWILRAVGFFMMFSGLAMVFKPLAVLADVLPFLGSLLGMGISIFAGIVSFFLSLLTISLAWIVYRPLLGISLLVIGTGIFFFMYKKAADKKKARAAAAQPITEKV